VVFDTIINLIHHPIAIIRLDKTISYCNESFLDFFSLEYKNTQNETCSEIIHGIKSCETLSNHICPIDCAIVLKKPCSIKCKHVQNKNKNANEEIFIIPIYDTNGKIFKFIYQIKSSEQIYKRINKQQKSLLNYYSSDYQENYIRIDEEIFRPIFENGTDCMAIVTLNLQIIKPNEIFCKIFDYSYEELIGIEFFELIHPDEKKRFKEFIDRSLKENNLIKEIETRCIIKNGTAIHVNLSLLEIYSNNNEPISKILIMENITKRKILEKTLFISNIFLEIANNHNEFSTMLQHFVREIQNITNCSSIGFRLLDKEGNIPYQAYHGFSDSFYESESPLSILNDKCMCISVIKGEMDENLPFITKGGSFYINGTTKFLATVSEEDKGKTRNVCNQVGYESVALIPIILSHKIIGLIHLADPKENMIDLETLLILEGVSTQIGTAIKRVQVQRDLNLSEFKFHKLFNSMNDGFTYNKMITDRNGNPSDFVFYNVNPAMCKYLDLNRDEIIGKMGSEIFSKFQINLKNWIETFSNVIQKNLPTSFEEHFEHLNKWFLINVYSFIDGEFVAIFTDISEKKKNYEEISKLAKFPSENPNPVLRISKDCEILYKNKASLGLLKRVKSEKGDSAQFQWHDYIQNALNLNSNQMAEVKCEKKVYSLTFAPIPQSNYVNVYGYNIADRIKMENLLATIKERLTVTLRSIGEGVISTDQEGFIILINKIAANLTGYSYSGSIGIHISEILHIFDEKTREPVTNLIKDVLNSISLNKIQSPKILMSKDGKEKIIDFTGSPLIDTNDVIIGYVLVFKDITFQRKIEKELIKNKRIESIGMLAGGIAHDFNNILTGILGNISLIKQNTIQDDINFPHIINAEKASLQARDLVRQLLTFSKGGTPIKEVESIREIIKESAKFVLHGSKVGVDYDFSTDLWPVKVDRGQIGQVMHNLVINAVQSIEDKGLITIAIKNEFINETNALSLKGGKYITVSIKDTGCGIPEQNIPNIFDLYFTTKEKGNGLGLSICYSIIKKHGGTITVNSKEGEGTEFSFYIPAEQKIKLEEKSAPKNENLDEMIKEKLKILLLEDDVSIQKVLKSMCENLNFEIIVTVDGSETIYEYSKSLNTESPFDFVILDLTIPGGMGGEETIEILTEIDPKIKAIITSGYATGEIMSNYKKFGFTGALTKPFTILDLNDVIYKVLHNSFLDQLIVL
jgi:PAS domain S-box-containing protein